jgi:excisionase family DNA binding protein
MECVMAHDSFGFGKDALTTGEVARICNVAARTVSKWIDAGRLEGYRIPGSRDRRVHVRALEAFVAAHGIPVSTAGADAVRGHTDNPTSSSRGSRTRVLVVDADRAAADTVREVLEGLGTHEVRTAAEALSAAAECGTWSPDVVVFDRSAGDATAFGAWVRRQHGLARCWLVASGGTGTPWATMPNGVDATLAKPYAVRSLVDAIERGSRSGRRALTAA